MSNSTTRHATTSSSLSSSPRTRQRKVKGGEGGAERGRRPTPEVAMLREENERLSKERKELETTLERLNRELQTHSIMNDNTTTPDPVVEAENAILKAQLQQYDLFLRSVMDNVESTELLTNETEMVNLDIAAQTTDFAFFEAMRLLQHSQDAVGWKVHPEALVGPNILPEGLAAAFSTEQRRDGGRTARVDIVGTRVGPTPAQVRDAYMLTWTDSTVLSNVMKSNIRHQNSQFQINILPDFSFEDEDGVNELKCDVLHCCEITPDGTNNDYVLLCMSKKIQAARSTLMPSREVARLMEDALTQPSSSSTNSSNSSNAGTGARKKAREAVAMPIGTTDCYIAARVIMRNIPVLGLSETTTGEKHVRMCHEFSEAIFSYYDTDESSTVRSVVLISIPEDFKLGDLRTADLVQENGLLTDRSLELAANFATVLYFHLLSVVNDGRGEDGER